METTYAIKAFQIPPFSIDIKLSTLTWVMEIGECGQVQEMEVQLQVNEIGEPQQTGREVWENRVEAEIAANSQTLTRSDSSAYLHKHLNLEKSLQANHCATERTAMLWQNHASQGPL